jgi:5-hydroxyisourate hydrolase-like protein (transthyretin family)
MDIQLAIKDMEWMHGHKGVDIFETIKSTNAKVLHLSCNQAFELASFLDRVGHTYSVEVIIVGPCPVSKSLLLLLAKVFPGSEIYYYMSPIQGIYHSITKFHNSNNDHFDDQDIEIFEDRCKVDFPETDYKIIKTQKHSSASISAEQLQQQQVKLGGVGELVIKIDDQWFLTGELCQQKEKYLNYVGHKTGLVKKNNKYHFPIKGLLTLSSLRFVTEGIYTELTSKRDTLAVVAINPIDQNNVATKQVIFDRVNEVKRIFNKNNLPLDLVCFVSTIPRKDNTIDYKELQQTLSSLHAESKCYKV